MAQILVTYELWVVVEPHIPARPRRPGQVGWHHIGNRKCLAGTFFAVFTCIQWEHSGASLAAAA